MRKIDDGIIKLIHLVEDIIAEKLDDIAIARL